jgi:hypothetical protein
MVTGVMEKTLNEIGYDFDKRLSLPTLFVFTNRNIGFQIGLYFVKSKWDNTLIPSLRISPSDVKRDLFYIAGDNTGFEFNSENYLNEKNLSKYLKIVLELFVSTGNQWIIDNSIKMFDALNVYEQIIDPRMEQIALKRVYTDGNILYGGKVIYEKDNFKVIFQHRNDISRVDCYIEKSGRQTWLRDVFDGKVINDLYIFPGFIHKEEYISILDTYISAIR